MQWNWATELELLAQPLPFNESDAVARHLRAYDRLSEELGSETLADCGSADGTGYTKTFSSSGRSIERGAMSAQYLERLTQPIFALAKCLKLLAPKRFR
jgi:hypothetical protein